MRSRPYLLFILALAFLLLIPSAQAQGELAATLEVLSAGVTVQRANTSNPIEVNVEAIVGVGDVIRTDGTGHARITFFADGTDTELLPSTEYRIEAFSGDETSFNLSVEVIAGQTLQRLNRLLDANSSYNVTTPGMALAARGTQFAVLVQDAGTSSMLVSEGTVNASEDEASADVPAEYGIRSAPDGALSDVVRASTFDELDSALDGCTAALSSVDDTRLNVRIGPSTSAPRVGTIGADEVSRLFGVDTDGAWYRIAFRGGYGWILSTSAQIEGTCAGLREFTSDTVEDSTLYEFLGDPISIEDLSITPSPEATEEAESADESN